MRLVLVNPPEIDGYVSDRDKAGGIGVARPRTKRRFGGAPYLPPTPAMDGLYALALAEANGVEARFVDAIARRWGAPETLDAVGASGAPDAIGVRISMPSLDQDVALANALKARYGASRVFLYGHASQTTLPQWRKRAQVDAVFFGEVEALLLPYLRGEAHPNVLNPQDPKAVALTWAYVEELDALPFPAWKHVDIAAYSPTGKQADFVYYLLTSRGCPKGCAMCPYYVHQGKQWRYRSIDNIVAELDMLRALGATRLQTRDPNISWRKPHLLAIAERLAGEKQFRISTETDLEALNEEDLKKLASAGFVRILTGVESMDEEILKKDIHQNGVALKRSLANMALCQKLGIAVTGFFIVGSLQETWRSVRNTVETAKALPIDYSVSLMTPYFGTELREEYIQAGFYREAKSFKEYCGYQTLVRTQGLDFEEVTLAHAWAQAELELAMRRRSTASQAGLARLKGQARYMLQSWRTAGLARQVAAREALAASRQATPQGAPAAA